jgi:thioredoxin-related protein
MRRVVTALIIVMVALALAACGSATPGTGAAGTPAAATPVAPVAAPAAATAPSDILSPKQTVTPGEMFPTDAATVPSAVASVMSAKKPMLVYFYDPTTWVSHDQRTSINATMKKYHGSINLVALDYTPGLDAATTLEAETGKVELLAAALKVNTTPYMLFVDQYGRITYRFAGWVDTALLNREVLRLIQ